MPLVTSGVKHGNLRERVMERMQELGAKCRDVRTREVGIQALKSNIHPSKVRRDYPFISVIHQAKRLTTKQIFGLLCDLNFSGRLPLPCGK